MSKPSLPPCNPEDKFVREYVRDSAAFVLCCVYEDQNGNEYAICQNQNGGEWIEE
jgi:hypothetical protein